MKPAQKLSRGIPGGKILEAVSEFPDMQVVLSVGKNLNPGDLGPIPSNTIVVRVAPPLKKLPRFPKEMITEHLSIDQMKDSMRAPWIVGDSLSLSSSGTSVVV